VAIWTTLLGVGVLLGSYFQGNTEPLFVLFFTYNLFVSCSMFTFVLRVSSFWDDLTTTYAAESTAGLVGAAQFVLQQQVARPCRDQGPFGRANQPSQPDWPRRAPRRAAALGLILPVRGTIGVRSGRK